MTRLSVVIAISTTLLGGAARAENLTIVPASPPKPDAVAKTGVETRVGSAWDCDMTNIAPVVWARADHGTVVIRNIIAPACGEQSVRQAGLFYKSEPGFKGQDKVYISGFLIKQRLDATLVVQVN